MSLLGFLTGVGSLFGGGDDSGDSRQSRNDQEHSVIDQVVGTKQTGTQTSQENSHEVTSYNQHTNTNETTDTRQDTTSQQDTSQTGRSVSSQTGQELSAQQQQTTTYSADVLASLDSLLNEMLASGGAQASQDAVRGRLAQVQALGEEPAFDVDSYVSGIAQAASSATQGDLDSRINNILSATGTSETGNSMSALLAARLRNDANANLAGVIASANAQGQQIKDAQQAGITDQIGSLSSDLSGTIANLLAVAQGGRQISSSTGQVTTAQQAESLDEMQQSTRGTSTSTGHSSTIGSVNTSGVQRTNSSTKIKNKENVSGVTTTRQEADKNSSSDTDTDSGGSSIGGFFNNLIKGLSKSAASA